MIRVVLVAVRIYYPSSKDVETNELIEYSFFRTQKCFETVQAKVDAYNSMPSLFQSFAKNKDVRSDGMTNEQVEVDD